MNGPRRIAMPRLLRAGLRCGAGLAAGLMLALPLHAQSDVAGAARAAARQIEQAQTLLDSAETREDRIGSLTATVRAFEDGLIALRQSLRQVTIREQALKADLEARSDEVARLLAVLQTMGQAPPPVLSLHPSGALGTARSGMILADVTPALQAEVEDLRSQLTELRELQLIQQSANAQVQGALDMAQAARAALAQAVAERTDLPRRFTEDPVALAVLIGAAETLDAFAAGLGQTVSEELAVIVPDALDYKGQLPLPVAGTILRRAGEADAAGVVRPGWVLAARPRALVTAPVPATLRYRGPLLDYGNVVIIEPAPDVLIIIAGLAEVFGTVGEVLPFGAPLGLTGGRAPDAEAILDPARATDGLNQTETLYLEVREGQSLADPATWFAQQ